MNELTTIVEDAEERMTSLQIAEVTGRQHKEVMRAIRKMESAWEKVNGRKFALVTYQDKKGESRPCYSLNKEECLYIATKFNDDRNSDSTGLRHECHPVEQGAGGYENPVQDARSVDTVRTVQDGRLRTQQGSGHREEQRNARSEVQHGVDNQGKALPVRGTKGQRHSSTDRAGDGNRQTAHRQSTNHQLHITTYER